MRKIKRMSNRILVQGKFRPKNPSKYKGDPTNIIYRSSWELTVFKYLDNNPEPIFDAIQKEWTEILDKFEKELPLQKEAPKQESLKSILHNLTHLCKAFQ